MIDIRTETLLPLSQVPKWLPPLRGRRRIHLGSVYRWASVGVGGITLETIKIGGTKITSAEAIQRFAERLSSDPASGPGPPSSAAGRQRAHEQAERELERGEW